MKFRHRIAAVGTVLLASIAIAASTPNAVAAAAPGKATGVASRSAVHAGSGVNVAFRLVNEDGSTSGEAGMSDCGQTGTCIICDVFPWAPYGSGTIIIYQGGVYCYQPDQNYRPAPVPRILMDLSILREFPRTLVRSQRYESAWTDHLDIVDAIPCTSGEYWTHMTVIVDFPECCPITDGGGFFSLIRPITC